MDSFQFFSAKRIVLRQLTAHDTSAVFVLRTHPFILKYVKKNVAKSEAEALAFIVSINEKMNSGILYYWAIADKDTDVLLGTICIWNISADKSFGEIGYEILPDFQNMGYAKEAIALVLNFGFLDLKFRKIEAWIHPQNKVSIHLIRKFGFYLQANNISNFDDGIDKEPIIAYVLSARKYFNRIK